MAGESTTATKFLILSDTHDFQFTDTGGTSRPLQLPTPLVDVLLHCGDLTQIGGVSSFKKAVKMFKSIDAELKLVIAGNHDLELDQQYWEAQRDEDGTPEDTEDHNSAITTMTGLLADKAGVIFLNEGTHSFTLKSGASFKSTSPLIPQLSATGPSHTSTTKTALMSPVTSRTERPRSPHTQYQTPLI